VATNLGGGIDDGVKGGSVVLDGSTVTSNSATTGGGILLRNGGTLTRTSSTVSGNTGGDLVMI
jgi:hypothetical protein